MKTSIYLSNRSITAVTCDGGRGAGLAVSRCLKAELPWGLVYNGTMVDAAGLKPHLAAFLRDLDGQTGKITLVIDGDAMPGKVFDVPALSPRKLRALICNELTITRPQDFLHDYAVISRNSGSGGGRVLAVATERSLVQPFTEIFADLGVLLRGIDLSQACSMRFFSCYAEYAGKTFICAFVDGPDIFSMLFVDGEYSFTDRAQLIEARGTPAAAVEISRALSSMVQYAYARKGTSPLSHAFLSGLFGEETQFYGDIGDALGIAGISVGPLVKPEAVSFGQQKVGDWGPYLFCLGDLMG